MRVRPALALINQVLDEVLSQQEGDFDADTRWCVEWFKSTGSSQDRSAMAETLSKGEEHCDRRAGARRRAEFARREGPAAVRSGPPGGL